MNEIYKAILNEIAKPIASLNLFQVEGVINKLKAGNMEDKLAAEALVRLNNYINLSMQIAGEQTKALSLFKQAMESRRLSE